MTLLCLLKSQAQLVRDIIRELTEQLSGIDVLSLLVSRLGVFASAPPPCQASWKTEPTSDLRAQASLGGLGTFLPAISTGHLGAEAPVLTFHSNHGALLTPVEHSSSASLALQSFPPKIENQDTVTMGKENAFIIKVISI